MERSAFTLKVSSTAFIEFMLSAINASLMEAISMSDVMSHALRDRAAERWKQIEQFLKSHDAIQNADVWPLGVSADICAIIKRKFCLLL